MTFLCSILTLQGERKKEIGVELKGKVDSDVQTQGLSKALSSCPGIFLMAAVVDATGL